MLAVRASADAIAAELMPRTSVAALNAPSSPWSPAIRGDRRAGERDSTARASRAGGCHVARVPLGDDGADRRSFTEMVRSVPRIAPARPWISGLTGALITAAEATDPCYWARQMRQPVRFMDGVG